VLGLVRYAGNAFAPINRIPPEVFSLIPNYWKDQGIERDLIALTHVCRGWREIFISRPSLWTYLDCRNTDKTRVYVERSRSFPLKIFLRTSKCISYYNDALLAVVPHTNRLGSLTICTLPNTLSDLLSRFLLPAPLLTELKIVLDPDSYGPSPIVPNTPLPELPSPLCKLSLSSVVTRLPWRNLSHLTVFEFRHVPEAIDPLFVTGLLDFFDSTPLLNRISLHDSIPTPLDVPAGRVVPLLHLQELIICGLPAHYNFIKHLIIPTASFVDLDFDFSTDTTPVPAYLANNFNNLHNITTIYLSLDRLSSHRRMRLVGPNGELRMSGSWAAETHSAAERQFLWSLREFDLSKTRRLGVSKFPPSPRKEIENSPIFQTLLLMKHLRTLTLIEVRDPSFIFSLNPGKNKSHTLLCPELEELVLYIRQQSWSYLRELMEMASERAKNHVKLSSITIVSLDEICPKEEVFRLRRCVSHVEYKLDVEPPRWNSVNDAEEWDGLQFSIDGESDGGSESDW